MTVSIVHLVLLAVFSGLAMNLILQLGIGLKGIAFDAHIGRKRLLAGCGIIFFTIMLLWLFFLFIRSILFLGLFEYVLLFPLTVLVFSCFEYLVTRFIFKQDTSWSPDEGESVFFRDTLTGSALAGSSLFLTLNIADSIVDATAVALGFSAGIALVYVVIAEIRRRADMEAVPRWLRGGPLVFIAMGLLSLVFSSGALMLFTVWGNN